MHYFSDRQEQSKIGKTISCKGTTVELDKLDTKQTKPSFQVGLGNKDPTYSKIVQLIGIVLLFLVGLGGSTRIYSKNRA